MYHRHECKVNIVPFGLFAMKCVYHPSYQVALPPGHPFPMSKYSLLKDRLLADGILAAGDILQPQPLDASNLQLVHTREYLAKLLSSALSAACPRRPCL